jgi:hypothetical protein
VLYTWLVKFKKADDLVAGGDLKAMQSEVAKLRRTTEERYTQKKAAAYFV